jgi:hypothetical protein
MDRRLNRKQLSWQRFLVLQNLTFAKNERRRWRDEAAPEIIFAAPCCHVPFSVYNSTLPALFSRNRLPSLIYRRTICTDLCPGLASLASGSVHLLCRISTSSGTLLTCRPDIEQTKSASRQVVPPSDDSNLSLSISFVLRMDVLPLGKLTLPFAGEGILPYCCPAPLAC